MKFFKPSLANLLGMLTGFLCAGGIGLLGFEGHRVLAETTSNLAAAHGLDMVTVALMIGAFIALVISFIVTHALEKYFSGGS